MEKEEEKVIDQNTEPAVEDEVTPNPEEETLAQTDEVLPAPEEPVSPEIPIDTIPATTNPLTVEEPVVEPVDVPVEEPVAEPIPEEPAPVDFTPEEPVVSDVVPEVGDENPTDIAEPVDAPVTVEEPVPGECPNCEGEGCPNCEPTPCVQGDGCSIGQIFGTFQEAVTIIWQYHLKTRKHHVHVTLNDFYEKALDVVDDLIEMYQGIHGIVEEPFTNNLCADGTSEVEYLNNLRAFVENNKFALGTDSEIASAVDDFLGLIDTTLYKLTSFTEHNVKSFSEFVYEDYVREGCGCSKDDEEDAGEDDDDDEFPLDDNGNPGRRSPYGGGEYTDEEEDPDEE